MAQRNQSGANLNYRGRFAPSPTGALHLGHARTYAVAWLRARRAGGEILMRIEDLDPPREVPGAADAILHDMEWLGFDWDGPVLRQSDRGEAYAEALDQLVESGAVYPCTCSRKEIASVASAPHGVEGLGVRYPGTCRNGPTHPDRDAAMRFRMPQPPTDFDDKFVGPVNASEWGGDFVLRRADGLWAYQLAVVVDDLQQGITEVVRGADLLASTPRQIALFASLGAPCPAYPLPCPAYLHVPLVTAADGSALSKRDGSLSVADLRNAGYKPERLWKVVLASLGVAGATSLAHALNAFDLSNLPTGSTSLTVRE